MKQLYKLVDQSWVLVEEGVEVVLPKDGIHRIEQDIEGGSVIIFETPQQ